MFTLPSVRFPAGQNIHMGYFDRKSRFVRKEARLCCKCAAMFRFFVLKEKDALSSGPQCAAQVAEPCERHGDAVSAM